MKMTVDEKRAFGSITLGIFLALVLLISYNLAVSDTTYTLATVEHVPESGLPLLLEEMRRIMVPGYGLTAGALAAVIAWILYHIRESIKSSRYAGNPLIIFVSILFGILNVSGLMVSETDAILSFSGVWALLGSLLLVGGWAYCFYLASVMCMVGIDLHFSGEKEERSSRKFVFLVFIFIIACWLIWIIPYYPASMDNDVFNQLKSWLVSHNDHHPWFTTVLLGLCYDLGKKFVSENAGIFLYVLLRDLMIAFVFANVAGVMRSRGLPKALYRGTVLFYAVTPVFGAYAKHAFKDTLSMGCYAAYLLTLYLVVDEIAHENETRPASAAFWHSAAALLTCLSRHNLVYVVLPVEVVVIILYMVRKCRKKALLLVLSVVMLFGYRIGLKQFNIESGSPVEALSIPLQQIGRVYRDDREALTDEDLQVLGSIFDMEKLAQYDPSVSDPIKSGFRQDVSKREVFPVLINVWFDFLKRFPLTYYEAAVGQSCGYYAFTPRLPERAGNWNSGMTVFDWIGCNGDYDEQFDFHYMERTQGVRSTLHAWVKVWDKIPLLSLTDVCALYTWLTVICGMYMLINRKYIYVLPVLSMILLIGTCMASPVNDCFRYFVPAAAAFPVLGCILKSAGEQRREG